MNFSLTFFKVELKKIIVLKPFNLSKKNFLIGFNNSFNALYYIGVWFMHCHLEVHTTWGLKMAFLVDNGKGPKQSVIAPPKDLPKC